MRHQWRIVLLGVLAIFFAGCGGSSDGSAAAGGGGIPSDCVAAASPTGAQVQVLGQATYDFVPVAAGLSGGLDFAATEVRPVRNATVEAVLAETGSILASGATDGSGFYSLSVPDNSCIQVRVRAEAGSAASAVSSWSVDVVDNTRNKALFALGGEVFDTGPEGQVGIDLHAASGWTGVGYASDAQRTAAPFAILDTAQVSLELLRAADPALQIAHLRLNWSPENVPAPGSTALGQIGGTHFDSGDDEIYVLGDLGTDPDEFDRHVLAHEVAHFFEWTLSRTDSIGGGHSPADRLDPRVAWSEGFGNAFSAMVLGDPVYADSFGPAPGGHVFSFDVEENTVTSPGWFSEFSVHSLVYDFFDGIDPAEGDNLNLGFAPIYSLMTGPLRTTEAFTTIYSFSELLGASVAGSTGEISSLLGAQQIFGRGLYGEGESNAGGVPASLPVYGFLAPGAPAVALTSSAENGTFNKLNNRHLFRFSLATTRSITLDISGGSNPDVFIYHQGAPVAAAQSTVSGVESLTVSLGAGDYVGEVYELQNIRPQATSGVSSTFTLQLQ